MIVPTPNRTRESLPISDGHAGEAAEAPPVMRADEPTMFIKIALMKRTGGDAKTAAVLSWLHAESGRYLWSVPLPMPIIAANVGMTPKQVERCINKCRRTGLLDARPGQGADRTLRYKVTAPACLFCSDDERAATIASGELERQDAIIAAVAARRVAPLPVPTVLYRWFDKDNVLLYTGITADLDRRVTQHSRHSAWFEQAVRNTTEWFPDRTTACAAELAAIRAEHPVHNVAGVIA
jgi:predicted GIY-YIG superfamily endonuclease